MSSLRNAVKRITHKERSQPRHRSHLGLLEKHTDYTRRARNYHQKEDAIRAIRKRGDDRNPDEFYMGMHNSQVRNGRHKKTEEARRKELEGVISADAVKIMKNQDLAYVRMQRQKDAKKIESLQSSLHFVHAAEEQGDDGGSSSSKRSGSKRKGGDGSGSNKHTIFVDDEKDVEGFDPVQHFDTLPELVGRKFNRPRVETLVKVAESKKKKKVSHGALWSDDDDEGDEKKSSKNKKKLSRKKRLLHEKEQEIEARSIAKARARAYAELEARNQRREEMALAESHLTTEKLVQGKGRKRKIKDAEDGKPAVYRWRTKRSK